MSNINKRRVIESVETMEQYQRRGGQVRICAPAWSRHLTDETTWLSILNGGTEADAARGFAWADLDASVLDGYWDAQRCAEACDER
ncbi:MAG: hypothetical protein ACO3DI_03960 [Ilumatobacteraceae bacterium]